jgi:hypothetical protein
MAPAVRRDAGRRRARRPRAGDPPSDLRGNLTPLSPPARPAAARPSALLRRSRRRA